MHDGKHTSPVRSSPRSPTSSPASVKSNPLKRKAPADTDDNGPDAREPCAAPPGASPEISPSKGEYASGRITCDDCGEGVSIRDDSGAFTSQHWKEHRKTHVPPSSVTTQANAYPADHLTSEAMASITQPPPAKRRRAKRTEEERIEYLRSDAYVAKYEAYRVLCKSCEKWIRLRPNSTYCSIPWDAHRKSCLAKKINNKNIYALEERNTLLAKDPDVRKFDAERVLCNMCDEWIAVSPQDHLQAVQSWLRHRDECSKRPSSSGSQAPSNPLPPQSIPGPTNHPRNSSSSPDGRNSPASGPPSDTDARPSSSHEHTHERLQSSHHPGPYPRPSVPSGPLPAPVSAPVPSFHDLTPMTYAPAHESRRRNAEQRAATLRADKLIGQVEPNRVFCSLCQKWVQLRQDSSYCAYPWIQHRGKCLARHQRRAEKAAEIAATKAKKYGTTPHPQSGSNPLPQPYPAVLSDDEPGDGVRGSSPSSSVDEQDPESEDAPGSNVEEERPHSTRSPRYTKQEDQAYRLLYSPESSSRYPRHQRDDHQDRDHDHRRDRDYPQSQPHRGRFFSNLTSNGYPPHRPVAKAGETRRAQSWTRRPDLGEGDVDVDADADGESYAEDERERERGRVPTTGSGSTSGPKANNGRSTASSAARGGSGKRGMPPTMADLDSAAGRRSFILTSIGHLFSTTYEPADDMSISTLLTYLNAAIPVDKHEDFDTSEVIKAVAFLHDRGKVRFEGDMIRPILD